METIFNLVCVIAFLSLAYKRASLLVWTITAAVLLAVYGYFSHEVSTWWVFSCIVFLAIAIPLNVLGLRRQWLTRIIMHTVKKQMPSISATEQAALDAGTVSWEGGLFSGTPNWSTLLAMPTAVLSAEEQAFLDGPVTKLCSLIDEWEITHQRADITKQIWSYIKEEGFFGLIIPKQYGGKEFSAYLHSEVLTRLGARSGVVAPTVSVPNSLGPAELLLHYGTAEQKEYYLPRLAKGLEVPCFALTSPEAGSDAASMPDVGYVCEAEYEGKKTLGIRVSWDKRYITLAPVATVLGLAFRLFDPQHLLGAQEDIGITCALIPTSTKGVKIGRRHFPLNSPFQNGPTQGKDIFIPMDWVIGGQAMVGQGWRMLVECLAAGRAISLPANAAGNAKLCTQSSSAYARVRRQFNQPISSFEGIQESLAAIINDCYIIEATRTLTTSFIDQGEKPSVLSAIIKYHATERSRSALIHAMDIHGGKGICLGPKNYLGRAYQGAPIPITVEGANILTRNMIIFGQGAMRCHPYVLTEIQSLNNADKRQGLVDFDKALFGHFGYIISNIFRSLLLGLSNSFLAGVPKGPTKRCMQKLTRFSTCFALVADVAMLICGSKLKRKEFLSARLGDVFSLNYLATCALKRFHDQGQPKEDLPVIRFVCENIFYETQQSLDQILRNLPNRVVAFFIRLCVFPLGRHYHLPSDNLTKQVVKLFLTPSETRARLIDGLFLKSQPNNPAGQLEACFAQVIKTAEIEKRLQQAQKERKISGIKLEDRINMAVEKNIISQNEAEAMRTTDKLVKAVVAVDDFSSEELAQQNNNTDSQTNSDQDQHLHDENDVDSFIRKHLDANTVSDDNT